MLQSFLFLTLHVRSTLVQTATKMETLWNATDPCSVQSGVTGQVLYRQEFMETMIQTPRLTSGFGFISHCLSVIRHIPDTSALTYSDDFTWSTNNKRCRSWSITAVVKQDYCLHARQTSYLFVERVLIVHWQEYFFRTRNEIENEIMENFIIQILILFLIEKFCVFRSNDNRTSPGSCEIH